MPNHQIDLLRREGDDGDLASYKCLACGKVWRSHEQPDWSGSCSAAADDARRDRRFAMAVGGVFVVALLLLVALTIRRAYLEQTWDKRIDSLKAVHGWAHLIEAYREEQGAYPVIGPAPVSEIASALAGYTDDIAPQYAEGLYDTDAWGNPIEGLRTTDAWGNPICIMTALRHVVVWSVGADGVPDPERPGGGVEGATSDLIWADGEFWQYPLGLSGDRESRADPFVHLGRPPESCREDAAR